MRPSGESVLTRYSSPGLYTPPLLGRKYQTFPVMKIETGKIISQQTEQGGGSEYGYRPSSCRSPWC